MMTVEEIKAELLVANHPVAKALHIGEHSKALLIAFNADMAVAEHTAKQPSTLLVLEGSIKYTEGAKSVTLLQYDEVKIAAGASHALLALEDSLCLLAQG